MEPEEEMNYEQEQEQQEDARLKELDSVIETADEQRLADLFDSMKPIDFAVLVSSVNDEKLPSLLYLLDNDRLAELMENAEDDERIRLAKALDNNRLLDTFEHMQKDDIVDMLGDFPIGRRKDVINLMKTDDRRIITKLLQYPDDSAGGLMTTAYIALLEDYTVVQALKQIREIGPKTEIIETIYIINAKKQLTGKVDLRELLSAGPDTLMKDIMDDNVVSVQPEADQEETARLVRRYDLNAIPVVSKTGQILGIVTVDDVIDVIVEEYDADMLQMAGVSSEENLDTTLKESIKLRLPWLLVNLVTAFLASAVVKMFEGTIAQVVALSAIMTIVSGMGGNAGSQTMSIVIRRLAQGDLKKEECRKPFSKELILGIINGAATGLVTAVVVSLVYGNIFLGLIVVMAMVGNLIISGFFGFLVPIMLKRFGADPAVASSIFVTTATDVLGFMLFLGLAKVFLPFLV